MVFILLQIIEFHGYMEKTFYLTGRALGKIQEIDIFFPGGPFKAFGNIRADG